MLQVPSWCTFIWEELKQVEKFRRNEENIVLPNKCFQRHDNYTYLFL